MNPQEQEAQAAHADAIKKQRNEERCPRAAALAHEFETELYETDPIPEVEHVLQMLVVTLDHLIQRGHDVSESWEAEAREYLDGARRARA